MTYRIKSNGIVSPLIEKRYNAIEKRLSEVLKEQGNNQYMGIGLVKLFESKPYTIQACDFKAMAEIWSKLGLGKIDITDKAGIYYDLEKLRDAIRTINKKWKEM